ncbi:MAG: hypothetical protein HY958_13380 [Bacteroidia bacterium]|nr:hypothetical protein [Bacteroidia bacterium]
MFFSRTSEFNDALNELLKKPKHGYVNCKEDIKNAFKDQVFQNIWQWPDVIFHQDNLKIVKLRLSNSFLKVGKSGGYRLVYVIFNDSEEICFLYIYPKSGALGADDLKDSAYPNFLKKYHKEKTENSLIEINFEEW